jgi:hypothetical protein
MMDVYERQASSLCKCKKGLSASHFVIGYPTAAQISYYTPICNYCFDIFIYMNGAPGIDRYSFIFTNLYSEWQKRGKARVALDDLFH